MSPQLGQGVNMALADALALRDALRECPSPADAFAAYERRRRDHLGIYHFWSRWLTPLFQSDRDRLAAMRDLVFHPLSRLPGGRGQMLRVLTGTRRGWLGTFPLDPAFVDALAERSPNAAVRLAGETA
jgi:2-polyprenyl-6-methoxyphenol hydroxylase-like FAD-dependent oxidoreductase